MLLEQLLGLLQVDGCNMLQLGTGHVFHRFSVLAEPENVGHEDGMHTESTRQERQAFASD